ncbi:MAG: hypothetical protein BIFFINMI_03217 [Phycisphaerae bacterium]|nr:hypothetical protein [Phycisphaerae bacterium]
MVAAWNPGSGSRPPLNVMVSDIRDQYADALGVLLEPHGFAITRVSSGDEAIWMVERRQVDAAVLDNDLPDMPGVRALRVIRTLNQVMPIILVGPGPADPAGAPLLQAALQLEAFSVLAQPVDLEVLLGQMARVFERFIERLADPLTAEPDDEQPADPSPEPMRPAAESGLAKILRFRKRG